MDFESLVSHIAKKFKEENIRYALIGGVALYALGYGRATGDLDLMVHIDDVTRVKELLMVLGYTTAHESQDISNMVSPWQLLGSIDIIKAHRKYAQTMLSRVKYYDLGKEDKLAVAAVEDIIGLKVQALANDPARYTRDLADIEWLLRRYRHKVDMGMVESYFKLFSKTDEFKNILARLAHAHG